MKITGSLGCRTLPWFDVQESPTDGLCDVGERRPGPFPAGHQAWNLSRETNPRLDARGAFRRRHTRAHALDSTTDKCNLAVPMLEAIDHGGTNGKEKVIDRAIHPDDQREPGQWDREHGVFDPLIGLRWGID